MRRVIFDKKVPVPLRKHLKGYVVRTAEDEGWGQISNGLLVDFASRAGYDILLTCEQNIRYQHNMAGRMISLVVLESNIWTAVLPKVSEITAALARATDGSFETVPIQAPPKARRVGDLRTLRAGYFAGSTSPWNFHEAV
jgi:hypothetical protein